MLEKLIGESKVLEHAIAGDELDLQDGIELMKYDNLYMIGAVADATRQKLVGNKVTFTASSYLNYTNVCAASCQICAFYRKENDNDAYTLTPEQIEGRVSAAKMMGATEMHIVGGFHPKLSLDYYESMMKLIKKNHHELKIKAFTAAEIFFFAKLTKKFCKGSVI
uniref:Radical SAM domain-containing protein n=1 Tax=uncultured marine thaumarchaeote KM3_97_A02 TaxID=1456349 RepID=A0A075HZA2_9ARCH|nr:radical SAM domain-containing protein [uncultured marine thaumarchaeote KM3_97_A02]